MLLGSGDKLEDVFLHELPQSEHMLRHIEYVAEVLCEHENVDFRGSSTSVHRVFCKDCQTHVYECPQSEYKEALANPDVFKEPDRSEKKGCLFEGAHILVLKNKQESSLLSC